MKTKQNRSRQRHFSRDAIPKIQFHLEAAGCIIFCEMMRTFSQHPDTRDGMVRQAALCGGKIVEAINAINGESHNNKKRAQVVSRRSTSGNRALN